MEDVISLEEYTHLSNIYFLAVSVVCFVLYLFFEFLFGFYVPCKSILIIDVAHCAFSVKVLGFRRSYASFLSCLIWLLMFRGLQGLMPSIRLYRRNRDLLAEHKAQMGKKAH
ncbi:hypothetical protein BgAZ_101010 [Babesia gibsoni]|uniref:Uncharacterized protein n=1 Tax=Babesia gibsoni TaxID=33632 RepID=A0AAD8PF27_BABGI|nr:hypothetical protein BgAZ_101010 [Babesia gibsoni]